MGEGLLHRTKAPRTSWLPGLAGGTHGLTDCATLLASYAFALMRPQAAKLGQNADARALGSPLPRMLGYCRQGAPAQDGTKAASTQATLLVLGGPQTPAPAPY